jgi:predicted metal-dependent TIM-barrel fold hydrolase
MNLVDAHTHTDCLTWRNLEEMSMAGIRTVISPLFLGGVKPVGNDVIVEMWDHLLEVQFPRCEANGIAPYGMVGISMVYTPKGDPEELYQALPRYLEEPGVVAIGEVGLEPASATCPDMKRQESILERQVAIGRDADVVVDLHVPNPLDQKREYTKRVLALCRDVGHAPSRVVVDHCAEANIKTVLDGGAWAAITVQPWRGMTPELAADLALQCGGERVIIDSDCGGAASDHLAVARTALALERKGADESLIRKVCGDNSREAYGLGTSPAHGRPAR